MGQKTHTSRFGFVKRTGAVLLSTAVLATTFTGIGAAFPQEETTVDAATVDYGLADTSQEGVILHCWNWSYNNIKKYMKDIAAAGYTSVQTSPVTQPKDYYWEGVAYGDVGIPDGTGDADHGNWWKVYQPVTMSICDNGYTWFGTKAEFKAMCDEAEKYGVRVIVDIVANHMGNIKGWKIGSEEEVMGDISPQVGEFWNPDMLTDSSYWHISDSWVHTSDGRYDVTQGNMGMPDLNTGDSKVQQMVLNLLKECIDCGADGFRFDAAKHIETPADDPAFASDFWNVVLGGARDYYKQVNGYDGVYFYGEVLNRLDDTNAEAYYRSVMSITDNSTSDNMRNSAINGQSSGLAISNYCGYINGEGDKAVLWAESHDTYMGGGSSYDANDTTINQTWAIVASRKDSTGLYFARPYYSKDILANDINKSRQDDATILANIDYTQMGDVGTLTWASPSVVAVNRFRNFFIGQSEKIGTSGNMAYNVRGNSGIVISKLDGAGAISLSVGMKDGTYTDQVTGEVFTVSNGVLKGNITGEDGVAVIYNPTVDYGPVNPEEPTTIKISASTADGSTSFTTDTVDVTLNVENAASATYETTEGAKGSFSSSKTITIGSTIAATETVSVTITATASDGTTKSKTYTFTKKGARTGYPTLNGGGVVFDNEEYNWNNVYVYVYDSDLVNNASWPGEKMTEVDGNYYTYEFPSKFDSTVYVIFNNGSGVQYPTGEGLTMLATEKKLLNNKTLIDLPENTETLKADLKASTTSCFVGDSIDFTVAVSCDSGTVKYKFETTDGEVIQASSTSNTCTWTPSAIGIYTVKVTATDSTSTATDTVTILVNGYSIEEPVNNSVISATSITLGTSVTLTGSASGGIAPYEYAYYYKKTSDTSWITAKNYSTATSVSIKPASATTYDICIKVKDSNEVVANKYFTLTVNHAALTNSSTISATSITKGNTVKVTGKASGGTSPYTYKYYYKKSTATTWQDGGSGASATIKPAYTGTYTVRVKATDSNGTVARKDFTVTVKAAALTNTSTISATSITKGNTVKVTGKATGGTSPYTYKYYYKKSTATTWQDGGSGASATIKPAYTGTYTVRVKATDSNGTVARKDFTVTVKAAALTNTSTISATSITKGNSVKVTGKATGGTSPYTYKYYYKKSTATTWQDGGSGASATIKPYYTGTYTVRVKITDASGTVARKDFTVTVK